MLSTDTDDLQVPLHTYAALVRYIDHGIPPGSFLQAVLENDLAAACARADHINRHALFNIVEFLYNRAPSGCWGSPENVINWRKEGYKSHQLYNGTT